MSLAGGRRHNERSMTNTLPSSAEMKRHDHVCGIHGAARARRGKKKANHAARRQRDKQLIAEERATDD